jgi:hypothetical protein
LPTAACALIGGTTGSSDLQADRILLSGRAVERMNPSVLGC